MQTRTSDFSAWLQLPPAAPTPEPGSARFTLDGDRELESSLARLCQRVAEGVVTLIPRAKLEAVLLGGGYGRGEGGVLLTESGHRPYNDLEFYLCLRGHPRVNEWLYGQALHRLEKILTTTAGIDVEFKVMSLDGLRDGSTTMFSYDLVLGHRWVLGGEHLLTGCEHHRQAAAIPLSEAARLLMNRCSGLLFSAQRLEHTVLTADDADFITRNLAKARLAMGDVILTAHGKYHWSCLERQCRLAAWDMPNVEPWFARVRELHAEGVQFKLHPRKQATAGRDELKRELAELRELTGHVWLWLERQRLHREFPSMQEYALSSVDKCPERASWWKHAAINLRTFGLKGLAGGRCFRYPRERVFNALALLLWEPATVRNPGLLRFVQGQLGSRATTLAGLVNWYQLLWSRFR